MTTFRDDGLFDPPAPVAAPRASLLPVQPTRVDRYRLLARLGQGGMGEVFLAVDENLHGGRRLVVLKFLHAHLHHDPASVQAFLEEGRVALSMNHAGLVQTLDVGAFEGRHYLVMEFLHGQTLQALMDHAKRGGQRLPRGVAARIVGDALDGLQVMHEAQGIDGQPLGLVHRDICPHNLFVTYHGESKLLDFGIANSALEPSTTQVAMLKGKLGYTAPELAAGKPPSERSDVWAMGVVLWEALCGRRLFDGPSEVATLQQVLHMPIAEQYPEDVHVPPAVHRVLMRALEREPEARYPSAGEMRDELGDWLASEARAANRKAVQQHVRGAFGDVMHHERELVRGQLEMQRHAPVGVTPSWPPLGQHAPPLATTTYAARDPWQAPTWAVGPDVSGSHSLPPALPLTQRVSVPAAAAEASHSESPAASEPVAELEVDGDDLEEITDEAVEEATEPPVRTLVPASSSPRQSTPARGISPLRSLVPSDAARPPRLERLAWAGATAALLLVIGLLALRSPNAAPQAREMATVAVEAPTTPSVPPAAATPPAPAGAMPPPEQPPAPIAEKPIVKPEEPTAPGRAAARARPRQAPSKPTPAPANVPERPAALDTRTAPVEPPQASDIAPRHAPEDAATGQFGFLTLDTKPWSDVSVDGAPLGRTPLVHVKLPAGSHELSLSNPELGVSTQYRVEIAPDATVRKRLAIE